MTVDDPHGSYSNVVIYCSWFAVHPVSMNKTNELISSDNKGYASLLFEAEFNQAAFPGEVFLLPVQVFMAIGFLYAWKLLYPFNYRN